MECFERLERRMERRSLRRRTLRRQNRQQRPVVHQPLSPGISGQGHPPPPNVGGQGSDGGGLPPHRPPSGSSSKMRVDMVARIRAERRNIAPEALTKHHLTENNAEKHHLAENNEENGKTESPKAVEGPNLVSGLIKRLSDKTRYELVR